MAGEIGGAFGGLGDFDQARNLVGMQGFLELEHGDMAQNDGEEVVEIVGDAASQLAKRLHFLGLAKLFLQQLVLGDVTPESHQATNQSLAVSKRHLGGQQRAFLAIGKNNNFLLLIDGFAGKNLLLVGAENCR